MCIMFGASLLFFNNNSLKPKIESLHRNEPENPVFYNTDAASVFAVVDALFRVSGVFLLVVGGLVIPCTIKLIIKIVTVLDIIEGFLESLSAMFMMGGEWFTRDVISRRLVFLSVLTHFLHTAVVVLSPLPLLHAQACSL